MDSSRMRERGNLEYRWALPQHRVVHDECIDLGGSETFDRVLRRLNDRLPGDVERSVQDHRDPGQTFEGGDQVVKAGIGGSLHCLYSSRSVDVRYCCYLMAFAGMDVNDSQHERARAEQVEPFGRFFGQYGGCVRTEGFA